MRKSILLPLLAVAGGAGGFFLRRWELATAFEESGLAIPWAPASVALIALSAALALAFALLCRGGSPALQEYGGAFSARGSRACLGACALAAALLAAAGLVGLGSELGGGQANLLRLLLWVLCLLSGGCVLRAARDNFRAQGRRYSLVLLAPAYTFCLFLIAAYQQRAADPVVLDYVYELFAIICTLLGLYFTAGFSFARGRVWRCAFFSLLGVYFSMVTLADGHELSSCLLFLFAALYQLATSAALLYHAFVCPPAPGPEPPPSPHPDEPNKTQEVSPDE